MADDPHVTAVFARLATDTVLRVFDSHVPDRTSPPYVLVYTSAYSSLGDDFDMNSGQRTTRFYCHCVGNTAATARAVAGRVHTLLINAVMTVPGFVCWPIRQDAAQTPVRDESTGVLVMDQITVYALASTTA